MNIRPNPTKEQSTAITALIESGTEEQEAISLFKSVHTVRAGKWVLRCALEEVIKKEGDKWILYSHEGKKLFQARTKAAVQKREEQIKFFKHQGETEEAKPAEEMSMKNKPTEENKLSEYAPWGIYTLADLQAQREAVEKSEELSDMTYDFIGLIENIVNDPTVTDKIGAIDSLCNEFSALIKNLPTSENQESANESEPESDTETLAESFDGAVVSGDFTEVSANPMYMDVRIIKPGWGNKRDNHYYPREMLARDAVKFEGAKMYETDHRDDEKSTRTWVSTIEKIARFDEDGSPVARVVVHDPNFAQRVANLKAADLLGKMECSIAAVGKMKPGFEENGRKGSMVEAITDVQSVDWVTKAGAGGAAVGISESDANTEPTQESEAPDNQPVNQEGQPNEPASLEPGAVVTILESSRLPAAARERLTSKAWKDTNELQTAIDGEIAYIKELTHSGEPSGLGASSKKPIDIKEIDRRKDELVKKALGG